MSDRRLAALGLRLVATLLLGAMFAIAKLAQQRGVGLVEVLFFRQALAILPVAALIALGPGFASLRTRRPAAHGWRMICGLSGMALNFATVALLPLAEATTLWFTTPLFATILSAVLLREGVGWHRWGVVLLGLVGVLIVIQPSSGHLPVFGAAIGLSASVMVAFTSILLRDIGRTEPALTTVFWFSVLSAVPLGLALPFFLQPHDATVWGLLIALGLVGGAGQIALTASLRFAPVSVLAPIDYASLIWSTAFGALLFGSWPTPWTWVGAPVIIASGLYIVWREHRLSRTAASASLV